MSNKYPCSARSAVEEHIIEDGLANVSVESREWVLDDVMTSRRIRYNVMVYDHSHQISKCPIQSIWRDRYLHVVSDHQKVICPVNTSRSSVTITNQQQIRLLRTLSPTSVMSPLGSTSRSASRQASCTAFQ